MTYSFGTVARAYAEKLGWAVIPLHEVVGGGGCSCKEGRACKTPGKHPRISEWQSKGSSDLGIIKEWAGRWPSANIGILCGARSGLVVLDVDLPGGDVTLELLEAEHGPLPATVTAITGSGGKHLLFRHPGFRVDNDSEGKVIGPDIHIRADGGQIVAAPSTHISGRRYAWEPDHRPLADSDGLGRVEIAPLPDWILERLRGTSRASGEKRRMSCEEIAGLVSSRPTKKGKGRHQALTALAGMLLSRRPPIPCKAILELLVGWDATHCNPALGAEEVARTLSGILGSRLSEQAEGEGYDNGHQAAQAG